MSPEDAALAGLLAGRRILLCYGLLGEMTAWFRLDYMAGQLAWLRGLGVAVEVVPLPTAAAVGANAGRIAAVLTAEPAPAVLVGHSKGGLEALAALLRPGAAARCCGFVALQAPFGGSPIADEVCRRRPLLLASHHALRLLGMGGGRGVRDLTTAVRGAWMERHAAELAALADAVPITSLATVLERGRGLQDRSLEPLARWMAAQGAGPSDGLVPVASTRLPGATHQVLEGGHRALVTGGPGRDPVGVLRRALLAVLGGAAGAPPEAAAIPSPPPPSPAPHPPSR